MILLNFRSSGIYNRHYWRINSYGFERNDGYAEYYKEYFYRRRKIDNNSNIFVDGIPSENNKLEKYAEDII